MTAGYQKFLEEDKTGLTNATQEVKGMMETYGTSGLHLDGHSRGSMTVGNALKSLQESTANNATPLPIQLSISLV